MRIPIRPLVLMHTTKIFPNGHSDDPAGPFDVLCADAHVGGAYAAGAHKVDSVSVFVLTTFSVVAGLGMEETAF